MEQTFNLVVTKTQLMLIKEILPRIPLAMMDPRFQANMELLKQINDLTQTKKELAKEN